MQVTTITEYNDFLELENNWKYIFEKCGAKNIFTSWEWCSLWWKYYGQNQKLMVLVVKDGEEIIGIVPLMLSDGNSSTLWRPRIRFIGEDIADYMDFLIPRDNKKVVKVIANFLIKLNNWEVIDLKRIPETSPNLIPIKECIAELNYPHVFRVSSISPFIKIETRWDDYYKSISKGLKQDIRTALNKFKLLGEINFETFDENALKSVLDTFSTLHKKRQSNKIGQSLFETQTNRNFFYDLAFTFTRRGWADISALKINDRVISVVFTFKYKGTFFYWIPAFDLEFSKYSPAKVHLQNLLKNCFEQSYKEFDFMRGDEDYKSRWANNVINNYEIKIFKNGLFCRLDTLKSASKSYIKDLYNKHPLFKKMLVKISKM